MPKLSSLTTIQMLLSLMQGLLISFDDAFNGQVNGVTGNIQYPKCSRVFEENAPVITSLNEGIEYVLMKDEKQQLMLSCSVENDVNVVYWYINDKFFKSLPASQKTFFAPVAGETKISCTDDKGRNTNILIQVTIL